MIKAHANQSYSCGQHRQTMTAGRGTARKKLFLSFCTSKASSMHKVGADHPQHYVQSVNMIRSGVNADLKQACGCDADQQPLTEGARTLALINHYLPMHGSSSVSELPRAQQAQTPKNPLLSLCGHCPAAS
jgi:hypothetical protein